MKVTKFGGSSLASASQLKKKYLISLKMIQKEDL